MTASCATLKSYLGSANTSPVIPRKPTSHRANSTTLPPRGSTNLHPASNVGWDSVPTAPKRTAKSGRSPNLRNSADGSFQGTVSSKDILSRDDFQYFVEVLTTDGGRRFPSNLDGQPYFVARVRRP